MSDDDRDSEGRFLPGKSGNPAGRPKSFKEITELARLACPAAVATLWKIFMDTKQPGLARVAACRELLDRGLGRAALQPVAIPADASDPIILGDAAGFAGLTALLMSAQKANEDAAVAKAAKAAKAAKPDADFIVEPNGQVRASSAANQPSAAPAPAADEAETTFVGFAKACTVAEVRLEEVANEGKRRLADVLADHKARGVTLADAKPSQPDEFKFERIPGTNNVRRVRKAG